MKRTAMLWAALSCASCATDLGIPFQRNGGHVSFVAGERDTNYEFIDSHPVQGVDWVQTESNTSGWGYEGSFLYGKGDGSGNDLVDNGPGTETVLKKRKTDFLELSFGVRQIYLPDSRLQPYFGVGGTAFEARNFDQWVLASGVPASDHSQTWGVGAYAHSGVQLNVLRNQLGPDTEFVLGLDLRGMLGTDYSYVELELSIGFGL